jgi:hypothetical protein
LPTSTHTISAIDLKNADSLATSVSSAEKAAEVGMVGGALSTLIHHIDTTGQQVTLTLRGYDITADTNLSEHFLA